MDVFEKRVTCPHCGHAIHMMFDTTCGDQNYFEDCPICCNTNHVVLHIDELHQTIQIFIDGDDEQIF
ncbi:CPXCG motif-containing cysteine-rich protein [Algicola sagamiensis]|uniref:CPXCG motif-containing cysteine-rich protein n=1 Tax=Algicola sagamiensis TaxID=163869 RepID=UPI00035C765A|nr:CPXCG motif-containing cysteine-rich protein [Algicola sagamiensis]